MRNTTLAIIVFLVVCVGLAIALVMPQNNNDDTLLQFKNDIHYDRLVTILSHQSHHLNPQVLEYGLRSYDHAKKEGLVKKPYLTIINYSLPSVKKRLWIIDMDTNTILYYTWVAHGKGSGTFKADKFSNVSGTKASSIGVYLTKNAYIGHDGYALRLRGLDKGFNDKAFKRDIVIHGAWYVKPSFIKKYGRTGRSWGCPALNPAVTTKIINTIKDGSIILAYFPSPKWVENSIYSQKIAP